MGSMDHLNVGRTKDYRDIAWLNASDYPLLTNDTEIFWDILKEEFSINRKKAWELSVYIYEHRKSIIHQNKESRCSPGFPCYKTAKRNLIKMERYWQKVKKVQNLKEMEEGAKLKIREIRNAKGIKVNVTDSFVDSEEPDKTDRVEKRA